MEHFRAALRGCRASKSPSAERSRESVDSAGRRDPGINGADSVQPQVDGIVVPVEAGSRPGGGTAWKSRPFP
jgi:hypothetical protein